MHAGTRVGGGGARVEVLGRNDLCFTPGKHGSLKAALPVIIVAMVEGRDLDLHAALGRCWR